MPLTLFNHIFLLHWVANHHTSELQKSFNVPSDNLLVSDNKSFLQGEMPESYDDTVK